MVFYSVEDLLPGARSCVNFYAEVGDRDSVLIVTDKPVIADALAHAVRETSESARVDSFYLSPALRPMVGVTPGLEEAIRSSSIVFSAFAAYDRELPFRRQIFGFDEGRYSRKVFNMPGVKEEAFTSKGALGLSESEMQRMETLTAEMAIALTLAESVTIRSPIYDSTNLRLSIGDADNVATASTGKVMPGAWGNLPSGEAFVLPDSAEGQIVIDTAVAGIDQASFESFLLNVVDGHAYVEGTPKALLEEKLISFEAAAKKDGYPAENVRRVCELGIGTNPHATPSSFLEVEKILGTSHIAVGSNKFFGGTIEAPNHIDMVSAKPTLTLDGKFTILEGGQVNVKALRDHIRVDATGMEPIDIFPGQEIERYPSKAAVNGQGLLWRQWTDARGNRLEVPIGSTHTAKAARGLWEAFTHSDKCSVGQLLKKYEERSHTPEGDARADALHLLQVLKRFRVIDIR